jgi:transcriptional regulator with XRE-family HTH domain
MNVNLNRIKAAMKAKKITNKAIASQVGVSREWISKVIRGREKSVRIKHAIADCLEIPYNELWPEAA